MTLQLVSMAEEIFLGLNVPQAVMGLAETIELGVDRIGLALLLEFRDRCQRHLDVGVDQLFTTFDFRKTQSGLRHNVQASNMSNKTSRIHSLAHEVKGLLHVIRVATTGSNDVGGGIMDIVEIERSLEISASRAREEVKTAVLPAVREYRLPAR